MDFELLGAAPSSFCFIVWSKLLKINLHSDMAKKKYVRNANKPWTGNDITQLAQFAVANTPTRVMGLKLGRPVGGVRAKASQLGISLKPMNRSPYSRRQS